MFKRFKESWKKKERINDDPVEFEKGDVTAIIIAAFTTLVPVVLLILGSIYLVLYLLFLR